MSLLSRLKNPTQYETTRGVVILPQDYYGDNILTENFLDNDNFNWTSTPYSLTDEPYGLNDINKRKINHKNEDSHDWRPLQNSPLNNNITIGNESVTLTRHNILHRPTLNSIYFKSRKTTEFSDSYEVAIPATSTKTWRPYFKNRPIFRNRNFYFETPVPTPSSKKTKHDKLFFVPWHRQENETNKNSNVGINEAIPRLLTTPTYFTLPSSSIDKSQLEPVSNKYLMRKLIPVSFRAKMSKCQANKLKLPRRRKESTKKKLWGILRRNAIKPTPKCYTCGLNLTGLSDTDCYDIDLKERHLRTKCPDAFLGGCFKRFLDVGTFYVERGCRKWPPAKGKSYASQRLRYLERLLKNEPEGCMLSPVASLTPFSKAISLYVRYESCVCTGKYCNPATMPLPHLMVCLFSWSFLVLNINTWYWKRHLSTY